MMTGRRGYGCGGLFSKKEVNITPLRLLMDLILK